MPLASTDNTADDPSFTSALGRPMPSQDKYRATDNQIFVDVRKKKAALPMKKQDVKATELDNIVASYGCANLIKTATRRAEASTTLLDA